jgi:hypothetical protein
MLLHQSSIFFVISEHNVTLRRVRVTIVAVDIFLCVGVGVRASLRAFSLTYPACNAPPHFHLQPLWFHHIFRHYLINVAIFFESIIKKNTDKSDS